MTARCRARRVLAAACALVGLAGVLTPAVPASASVRACSRGLVALTFDDGPAAGVTGRLLDVLSSRGVPATFFVVGQRVRATPTLVRRAHRLGFVVANHTHGHEMLTRLSADGIRRTVSATDRAIRDAGAAPAPLVRPPYGAVDARVRSVLSRMGKATVLWDVDPRDWKSGTSGQIAARVLGALRPGGRNIVLLHDGVARSEATLGAVPAIVRGARDRGYCFAALGPSGDPVPPVPRARVTDAVATEPDPGETAAMRFTVRLDRPTTRAVSVRVRTVAGTAVADQDYAPVSRRVDFPAGVTSRRVVVRVRGDRVDEAKERLRLVLDRPRGLLIADRAGVGVIRDDDPAPRVRLVDATVEEPLAGVVSGAVRVALDRPSSRRVDVVLATVPGSAGPTDFTAFEVAISLAPGRTGFEVPVEVLADAVDEPVETFVVQVLSVTRAEVADGTATVTITPPPAAPPPEAPVAP